MSEPKRPNSFVFNEAMLKGFINGTLEPAVEEKVANLFEARPDLLAKISAKSGDGFLNRLREVQQRSAAKPRGDVKASIVQPAAVNKAVANSDSSIPEALAHYSGYKITKELGRGGMGVVYLAKNIQMDRLEVLKVLSERLLDHEGAKERFLREIRAVSKLSHANIVTSYSILPLDKLLVFAMEYVHGIDLHQYTHKYKPLSVGLACSFAKQIAAGLQHAHEKGLVHRDIKPSNVIVYKSDGQLQLKILDFGLAKATSEEVAAGAGLTQDGTMLGTPEYMSPEQTLNAAKADIRADIYSLGCTLYYMLTGKPPFHGTHGAVLIAHAQREPTALNLVRPDVPAELTAVVGKMLAKDLRKRYQSPSEVASALTPFVNQTRHIQKPSIGKATVSNTVNDLNDPDRETSVDAPLSELKSLDGNENQKPAMSWEEKISQAGLAATYHRRANKSPKTNPLKMGWIGGLVSLAALIPIIFWTSGLLTVKSSDGTVNVSNGGQHHLSTSLADTAKTPHTLKRSTGDAYSNTVADNTRELSVEKIGTLKYDGGVVSNLITNYEASRVIASVSNELNLPQGEFRAGNYSVVGWNDGTAEASFRHQTEWHADGLVVDQEWENVAFIEGYGWSRNLHVVNSTDGRKIQSFELPNNRGGSFALAFRTANEIYSVRADGHTRCWNWREKLEVPIAQIASVPIDFTRRLLGGAACCFSSDSSRVFACNERGVISCCSLFTGARLGTFECEADLSALRVSNDGRRLAVSSPKEKTIAVFDVATQQSVLKIGEENLLAEATSISPDGTLLAIGLEDGSCQIWSVELKSILKTFHAHKAPISSTTFACDGKKLITGSADRRVHIWRCSYD